MQVRYTSTRSQTQTHSHNPPIALAGRSFAQQVSNRRFVFTPHECINVCVMTREFDHPPPQWPLAKSVGKKRFTSNKQFRNCIEKGNTIFWYKILSISTCSTRRMWISISGSAYYIEYIRERGLNAVWLNRFLGHITSNPEHIYINCIHILNMSGLDDLQRGGAWRHPAQIWFGLSFPPTLSLSLPLSESCKRRCESHYQLRRRHRHFVNINQ